MSDLVRGHIVCVYRAANEERVTNLLSRPLGLGWSAALWALDGPAPTLAKHTVGSGPGGKWDLLNAAIEQSPCPPDSHLVISDDDITIGRGGLPHLVRVMDRAGLDLAQPANDRSSYASYKITRRVSLSRARLTTFVEIGPVVCVAPRWLNRVLPFPADIGMGWGLDLAWRDLRDEGCRLGVIDAVPVRHPDTPGQTYKPTLEAEYARMAAELQRVSLATMEEAQQTLAVWRPWQRRPPWTR